MHVGIFLEERRRDTSEAAALQETVELAEAAYGWFLGANDLCVVWPTAV